MGGEIYQAQVLRSFFDTLTAPTRDIKRVYFCVVTLMRLRQEDPAIVSHLEEQLQKSKVNKELSRDIVDYMCDVAREIEITIVQTAFGVKEIKEMVDDFHGISLDSF